MHFYYIFFINIYEKNIIEMPWLIVIGIIKLFYEKNIIEMLLFIVDWNNKITILPFQKT